MGAHKMDFGGDTNAVFGLGLRRLQPILDEVAGERVTRCAVKVDKEVQGHRGYSAEKIIPTFLWTTASGRTGETTVFVKWFKDPGPHEARHYKWLSKCGAPIARMYGSLLTPDKREMIFLEYLDYVDAMHPFDEFLLDAGKFLRFVSAVARFNAVRPPVRYASQLPAWKCAGALRGAHDVLDDVWKHSAAGTLGEQLASACIEHAGELGPLHLAIEKVAAPIDRMETGLCHNDLSPDSTCLDPRSGRGVIVDLESVSIGPRFRDIARWLGGTAQDGRSCVSRQSAAEYYLEEYHRAGGPLVPVEQLLAEARLLRFACLVETLWFSLRRAIDGRVDWTDDVREGRRVFREGLYRAIKALLEDVQGCP